MAVNGRAPRFSAHATQRRIEMALTSTEVLETVADPECVYPAHQDRVMFKRGRLVVITDDRVRQIITILWAGKDGRDE